MDVLNLVCTPWMEPDELTLCKPDTFATPEDAALVLAGANDLLYVASARQFPGVCSDTIRPASTNLPGIAGMSVGAWPRTSDGGTWAPFGGVDLLPEATFGGVGGVRGDSVLSGFRVASTVRLPGNPIIEVTDVQIGDVHLTHGVDFFIVDDTWLIRANGLSWPWTERMDRADTQDLWAIEYTFGTPPPSAGIIALNSLTCELGLAFKKDTACRLPKRLQSITREGMTAVILDPFSFLDKGRFGVYEIDSFIAAVNPDGLDRDGKVLNVDLVQGRARHVR